MMLTESRAVSILTHGNLDVDCVISISGCKFAERRARTFVPIAIPQAGFARHFGPQQRSDRNRRFETIRVKLDDVVYYVFLILVILCLS